MLRLALLLVLTLPLAACQLAVPFAAAQVAVPIATSQTVLRGTKQMVEIRTEPPGATVSIPGYSPRVTPTFIMLARGNSHTVRIAKDGFKAVTANLTSQRASTDSSSTNVLGGALDEVSGAAWELNHGRLTVTLESLTPVAGAAVATGEPAAAPAADIAVKPKGAPGLATPPIVQRPTPPPAPDNDAATVLNEQLARLDKLLDQGVITKREHEILTAMALSATAVAGASTSP